MRELTLETYMNLPINKRQEIDIWLDKWDLKSATRIVQVEPDGWGTVLEVYGVNYPKLFNLRGESVEYISDGLTPEGDPPPDIKLARFMHDDFPWHVLDEPA